MNRTWLTGTAGVLTLVVAVVLMACSAPGSQAQDHGTATTQSATTQSATLP
jgi:hypothetical protein